jgi:flagellar hook-associated protein 1 FlgK
MAGLLDGLGIGYSGLTAARAGVNLAGHNIANVNTEGYHQRDLLQSPAGPNTGGVSLDGEARIDAGLLDRQAEVSRDQQGNAEARHRLLLDLEQVIGDMGEQGLGALVSGLFNSFSELATAPEDRAVRGQALAAADRLARWFNSASSSLAEVGSRTNQQIVNSLDQINGQADEIAQLNARILQTEASGQSAHDLRDRRELLVAELAGKLGARSLQSDDGQVTVLVDGLVLVQGDQATQLVATAGDDASRNHLALASGATQIDVTERLGGEIGGLLAIRDRSIPQLGADLDEFAFELSSALNGQHRAGFGLDGVGNRDLYGPLAVVDGAAGALAVAPGLTADGLAASSSAAELPGNNANALALAQLASATIVAGGNQTASERAANLVSAVGSSTQQAAADELVATDELTHLQMLQQSAEGVSLDEEMVHLIEYQRAYQASARVLQVVNELLGRLMEL